MATPEVVSYDEATADIPVADAMAKTRKDRPTGSTHFGDENYLDQEVDDIQEATWTEVYQTCCCHTPKEWGYIIIGIIGVLFFLYFFLIGLDLLSTGAKVMTGCTAGALFGDNQNPVAGLMIGMLATVLLQSSSTTTSIIVSLVGAGTIGVQSAIYMVMGANIGTSVTNTIVAMGQMGDGPQLERAFAGATVHDMFNFLTVAILLPVEAATGYLYHLTTAITKNTTMSEGGETFDSPLSAIIDPVIDAIIKENKNIIKDVAAGEQCSDYYPVYCAGYPSTGQVNYKTCADTKAYPESRVGLITCVKSTGKCPAFFQDGATQNQDVASGGVVLVLGLIILITCLVGLVSVLSKMLLGASTRIIYKATNVNGYIAMIIGAGITIVVQSSSITTSVLTPLVGLGVVRLEQMYPMTLGANIGTTVTGLLSALVSESVEALDVALAHLFFNITGIIIWYPIPFMRRIPLAAARSLGKATKMWRGFPVLYIAVMFFLLPLVLLGVSYLFTMGSKGFTVLGAIIVCGIILGILYFIVWWYWRGGKMETKECFRKREIRRKTNETLPDDMEYIKHELARLKDHTCLPDDENATKEVDVEEGGASDNTASDNVAPDEKDV